MEHGLFLLLTISMFLISIIMTEQRMRADNSLVMVFFLWPVIVAMEATDTNKEFKTRGEALLATWLFGFCYSAFVSWQGALAYLVFSVVWLIVPPVIAVMAIVGRHAIKENCAGSGIN